MVILSETMTEAFTLKKLKLTSNKVYVNDNVFIKYDILYTVEKVLKSAISCEIFENVDWNYHNPKPEKRYVDEKIFIVNDIRFIRNHI